MKLQILMIFALFYFSEAWRLKHYPKYEQILRETEGAYNEIDKLVMATENVPKDNDSSNKVAKDVEKKINDAFEEEDKKLSDLKKENPQIRSKTLDEWMEKLKSHKNEANKIKEGSITDVNDSKNKIQNEVRPLRDQINNFKQLIEKCKKEVNNLIDAINGYVCLRSVKSRILLSKSKFIIAKTKIDRIERVTIRNREAALFQISKNIDKFLKNLTFESNGVITSIRQEIEENKKNAATTEPSPPSESSNEKEGAKDLPKKPDMSGSDNNLKDDDSKGLPEEMVPNNKSSDKTSKDTIPPLPNGNSDKKEGSKENSKSAIPGAGPEKTPSKRVPEEPKVPGPGTDAAPTEGPVTDQTEITPTENSDMIESETDVVPTTLSDDAESTTPPVMESDLDVTTVQEPDMSQ